MKRLAIILLLILPAAWAQNLKDTTYCIEVKTTISPLISFFKNERYPGVSDKAVLGYGIFLRGIWRPGRILAVGLMMGYAFLAEDELNLNNTSLNGLYNKASARLTAIPLQVVVSMENSGAEIGVGMGPYLMLTTIDYGKTANGNRLELGLTFFGSYVFSIGDHFHVGPELRVLYLSYRGIISLMPSIAFHLDTYRY